MPLRSSRGDRQHMPGAIFALPSFPPVGLGDMEDRAAQTSFPIHLRTRVPAFCRSPALGEPLTIASGPTLYSVAGGPPRDHPKLPQWAATTRSVDVHRHT